MCGVCASDINTSASLLGLEHKYQRATSIALSKTEQPCACMLTVLIVRESCPYMLAITSEARQGKSCDGVLVAAMSRPMRRGSPPQRAMALRAALMPRSVEECVCCIASPARYAG